MAETKFRYDDVSFGWDDAVITGRIESRNRAAIEGNSETENEVRARLEKILSSHPEKIDKVIAQLLGDMAPSFISSGATREIAEEVLLSALSQRAAELLQTVPHNPKGSTVSRRD